MRALLVVQMPPKNRKVGLKINLCYTGNPTNPSHCTVIWYTVEDLGHKLKLGNKQTNKTCILEVYALKLPETILLLACCG